MNKGISVVIRNRNEAEYIGFAIQSVIDHLPVNETEIIVCDNESTDDSMYVVSLFNDRVNIKTHTIGNKEYTPGRALNTCFGLASNDIVLVLSAHCQILDINFNDGISVNEVMYPSIVQFFDQGYSAVFGKQFPIYRGKKISRRYVWSNFTDTSLPVENPMSENEDRHFLHNAFCVYKRDAVLMLPFDEELSGKEDRYWAADLVMSGGKYLYNPHMQCNHFYTGAGATWKGIG